MIRAALLNLALTTVLIACGQSNTNMRAVRLMAEVDSIAPSITLRWQEFPSVTAYTIFRRAAGATTWGPAIATLPGTALQYEDLTVQLGTGYEYKVQRTAGSTGYGYVRSGIMMPPVEYRGKMVLVVASGLVDQIEAGIAGLEADLNADGWMVIRHELTTEATPGSVRELIQNDYDAEPSEVKAVYLLGHTPVAYTGDHAPDGHGYHQGAWPCDGYFGEMNGPWTDNSVSSVGSTWSWNHNIPGDGKFDQNDMAGEVELQVGRVDLHDLTVFATPEADLLTAYLQRAHAWKRAEWTVPGTAVVWDNLEWSDYPLAVSGYLSAAPCVGIDGVTQLDPQQGRFRDHYLVYDDLFTCHVSTGLKYDIQGTSIFPGTDHGLNDTDLVACTHGGVFNLSVGSYYGDWDNRDNFLRAVIAKGNALAHVWSGMPNWYLHPMGMGEPIGYCAWRTMNNVNNDYSLQNGGWQGQSMEQSHMTLMGDPSLRMRYVSPPTDLVATNEQWFARFDWSPSPSAVEGYLIYRIDDVEDTIVRVTPEPVQGTQYISDQPFIPGARYMVRALRLMTTPSGSYYDLSLGAEAIAEGELVADCEGVVGGTAIPGAPCDDGDPLTVADVYDLSCDCAGSPIGLEENEQDAALSLWPSPAGDVLQVSVQRPGGTYIIRTMDSSEVKRGAVVTAIQRIDTSALPAGAYLLEYRKDRDIQPVYRRFVVQR